MILFKKSLSLYKASKSISNIGNAHKVRKKKISKEKSLVYPKANGVKSTRHKLIQKEGILEYLNKI